MRYAKEEWEQERSGWRSVVLLNIVRSITTIIRVLEVEMNGASPFDDSDQHSITTVESSQSDTLKFTEKHQLLMLRLAPVLSLEDELKRRLGAETEPVLLPSMVAAPFDTPQQPPGGRRRLVELFVRSWKNVTEAEQAAALQGVGPVPFGRDSPTIVMAQCKDDMKALWQDKTVQCALNRRGLVLADSAGLSASFHPTGVSTQLTSSFLAS